MVRQPPINQAQPVVYLAVVNQHRHSHRLPTLAEASSATPIRLREVDFLEGRNSRLEDFSEANSKHRLKHPLQIQGDFLVKVSSISHKQLALAYLVGSPSNNRIKVSDVCLHAKIKGLKINNNSPPRTKVACSHNRTRVV